MTDNKQNAETENKQSSSDNKTTGGGATSAQQAKEGSSSTPNKTGGQGASSGGASQSSSVANAAKDALTQVKESAGAVAGDALGQVKDKASSVLGEQKSTLASGVASVADSIRQVGENIGSSSEDNQVAAFAGKYGETLAAQVDKFSNYIDEKELRELARDVEQFARRNPILFVGGAFALGVLAARFLKSSGQKKSAARRS